MSGKLRFLSVMLHVVLAATLVLQSASPVFAAIAWDGEAGTQWWFAPMNWNTNSNINTVVPPSNGVTPPAATDITISSGTIALPGGEGVVYDPSPNDPNFAAAGGQTFPPLADASGNYSRQLISQFYISRGTTTSNLLTIKGDMEVRNVGSQGVIVGRSSGTAGVLTQGRVNQLAGNVVINHNLDLGATDTSNAGFGKGTWDYHSGSLEVGVGPSAAGNGIRLSSGGSAGTGGSGHFIVHNPASPGHIQVLNYNVGAHGGLAGMPDISANGTTRGVGITEFHFANGGVRPIQIANQLLINNGLVTNGTRSAQLDLVLDAAPTVTLDKPQDLALFDVDYSATDFFTGAIIGDGDLGDFFSDANASNPLDPGALYGEGATVSAVFGNTQYNWKISYTGNILWDSEADQLASIIGEIQGPGMGGDVVLIGDSVETLPGLAGDFNNNHVVDAADYTLWRNNLGATEGTLLNGNGNGGTIDSTDYDLWKLHFGESGGPGSGSLAAGAVSEPGTLLMCMLSVFGFVGFRRRAA